MSLVSALRRQRWADLCELKDYEVSGKSFCPPGLHGEILVGLFLKLDTERGEEHIFFLFVFLLILVLRVSPSN